MLAAQADDSLDEGRLVAIAVGVEHDDVAARVLVEAGRDLVDEEMLARLQGLKHRLLLDTERLHHERRDDEIEDDGQADRRDDLDDGVHGP